MTSSQYTRFRKYNILLGLIAVLLCRKSDASIYQTRFTNTTWDDDNWALLTTSLDSGHYQSRASLANGYIGINVAALGPFFEVDEPVNGDNINGWPLFDRRQTFATIAGFYNEQPTTNGTNFPWLNQLGGESVISGIPHWSNLIIKCNGNTLNASTPREQIRGFSSALDMKSGLLTWNYTWMVPQAQTELNIKYSMFLHKLHVNQASVRLSVSSSQAINVSVIDILNGDGATRTTFFKKGYEAMSHSIWTAVQPLNIPYVTGYVYSTLVGDRSCESSQLLHDSIYISGNASSIAQYTNIILVADQASIITKYIGIASSDAFNDPKYTAQQASISGSKRGYEAMFLSHVREWEIIMPRDSVDRFRFSNGTLANDQNVIDHEIMAVSNPFAILQNTVGENAISASKNNTKLDINSIAVGGLTSDSYAGLIFWDVEVWMQPGLLLAFPAATKQIANYRLQKYAEAKLNIQEKFITSQNATQFSDNAAIFPWTSGRFGNCTGTGPCFDYEYHINGDIALELENYFIVSGDVARFQDDYFPIYNSIAETYSNLIYLNQTSSTYMLRNATDPDEFANNVNNPAYTMVLIKTTLNRANAFREQFNMPTMELWTRQAANIEMPTDADADIVLEYTEMNGTISVKQADVVLIDDFLHYPNPYTRSDLDFYAGKQSLIGPGMTFGVFSNIASSYSPSGCSDYTYDLYGSIPYARAPWYQYSEQLVDDYSINGGFHPAFPFLTGMGGANRVSPFGYLGLQLRNDSFNINPTLPPQLPNLAYRTIYWHGYAISVISNATHTVLTRMSQSLSTASDGYAHAAIPVTIGLDTKIYNLTKGTSLTIPTRQPHLILTTPKNLAQCLPAVSNQSYLPGQFPLAAVDGAVSTAWRPTIANTTASLTVTLGEKGLVPISAFLFDWAQSPPQTISIFFSNSTTPSEGQMIYAINDQRISISNPYEPEYAARLESYTSNTTNITLPSLVWGGRYATLVILGNQAGNTSDTSATNGASVAEWAIIAADSSS